jgi:predicted transcriptional regulator
VIVREAIVADPRVLAADAEVREVAALLSRPNVRSALVVDGDRLVGCVTTESIVAALARGEDVSRLSARDFADAQVTSVPADLPLDEALHLMAAEDLERLAVLDGDRFVGVLPRDGLVRRLAEDEPPPSDDEPLGVR